MSQSTNDAYPTSFKLAFIFMNEELVADLKLLIQAFRAKGEEFKWDVPSCRMLCR